MLAPIRVRIRIRQEVKDKARANLTATRQALEDERDAEEDEEKKRNLDDLIDAMPREEEFSLLEEDASVIASPVECRGIVRVALFSRSLPQALTNWFTLTGTSLDRRDVGRQVSRGRRALPKVSLRLPLPAKVLH